MKHIINELEKMNITYVNITEIHSKDRILVHRVTCKNGTSYVIKYFANESDRREIKNYEILQSLGIQTLNIISKTDCALFMEDIEKSKLYRLGTAVDMQDVVVAKALAKWYKSLHTQGIPYIKEHENEMYDEADCITLNNIEHIANKTDTANDRTWRFIKSNFEVIKNMIDTAQRTLAYNDFYYTNFIVSNDKSTAFMFDYNLLGKGYSYSDLRNVTFSLGEKAKAAFLKEYGDFDKSQEIIDDVASVITTLYSACKRDIMPKWSFQYVEQIKNGQLLKAVERLLT